MANQNQNNDAKIQNETNTSENRPMSLEAQVAVVTAKVDMFIGEMREQNKMRAEEIREIRTSIDGMGKHVRNLTVAAIVGIGAISISVIGFVISVVLK